MTTVTQANTRQITHIHHRNDCEMPDQADCYANQYGTNAAYASRNAPELGCAVCRQIILRTTTVVRIAAGYPSDVQEPCYSYWGVRGVRPLVVCEPCWDAATPIPWRTSYGRRSPHIQRHAGGWVLQITSGSRYPSVQYGCCEHCGRRVLADMSRRRLVSCSNRCQVYVSQQRWPKPPKQEWMRPPDQRRCRRCKQVFKPRTRGHEYCSNACRQAAYRVRRTR